MKILSILLFLKISIVASVCPFKSPFQIRLEQETSPPLGFKSPQSKSLSPLSQFFKEEFESQFNKVFDGEVGFLFHSNEDQMRVFDIQTMKLIDMVDISDLPLFDTAKAISHACAGLHLVLKRDFDAESKEKLEFFINEASKARSDLFMYKEPVQIMTVLDQILKTAKTAVLTNTTLTGQELKEFQSNLRGILFEISEIGTRVQMEALDSAFRQLYKIHVSAVPNASIYAVSTNGFPRGNPATIFFEAILGRRGYGDGVWFFDVKTDAEMFHELKWNTMESRLIFGNDLTMVTDVRAPGAKKFVEEMQRSGEYPLALRSNSP